MNEDELLEDYPDDCCQQCGRVLELVGDGDLVCFACKERDERGVRKQRWEGGRRGMERRGRGEAREERVCMPWRRSWHIF